jgi:thioesterase domain-containing protein
MTSSTLEPRTGRFLRDVLDGVDGPIVLAGHSYGGSVLSEAADGQVIDQAARATAA